MSAVFVSGTFGAMVHQVRNESEPPLEKIQYISGHAVRY